VLERAFPGPRFVRIVRHDVVAQAVSFDKAIRTARWHDWDPPSQDVPLEFDFDRVDHLVRELREHEAAWTAWFDRNDIDPLTFAYEEVVDDMAGAVSRALAFLGIDPPADLCVAARTERQADELNADWARRYRQRAT
jgi:LPS sulfotransferase NodH